jgi:PAS domain S-box-containing protein
MLESASAATPPVLAPQPARDSAEIEKNRAANTPAHVDSAEQLGRDVATIRASELAYRRLFEAARDGILILDVANGRVRDVNPFLIDLLGYSRSEMLGKTVGELSPFKDLVSNQAMLERLQQDGYVRYEDLPLATADGRYIDVEFVSNVYGEGDKQVIQCNIRDISKRKQGEEDRLAKVVAERANLAKTEFLSRMSHELRTPLNAILGFGQLLEMGILTAKQREGVEHILSGGHQLLELVDEVLDIARIESGRMVMELEAVAIQDLVHETLKLMRPLAATMEVALHVREGIGPPPNLESGPYVTADRQRLRQVLLNLLGNAIKFNVKGGQVTVTYALNAGKLRLRVSDTGPGIAVDKQRRLFTPFDRLGADSWATGSGLGLSLSKRLMEAMGGNLGLEELSTATLSEGPPSGAMFWAELPLVTGLPAPVAEPPESIVLSLQGGSLPSGCTLLYIEDNISNLKVIERLMDAYPEVRLLTALLGNQGLELARQERPDLILLDVHLPDVPGWNVLAQLRAEDSTRDIPVIVISADATEAQIRRLREAGAYDYLTKPLDLRKFLEVLRKALVNRKRDRRENPVASKER